MEVTALPSSSTHFTPSLDLLRRHLHQNRLQIYLLPPTHTPPALFNQPEWVHPSHSSNHHERVSSFLPAVFSSSPATQRLSLEPRTFGWAVEIVLWTVWRLDLGQNVWGLFFAITPRNDCQLPCLCRPEWPQSPLIKIQFLSSRLHRVSVSDPTTRQNHCALPWFGREGNPGIAAERAGGPTQPSDVPPAFPDPFPPAKPTPRRAPTIWIRPHRWPTLRHSRDFTRIKRASFPSKPRRLAPCASLHLSTHLHPPTFRSHLTFNPSPSATPTSSSLRVIPRTITTRTLRRSTPSKGGTRTSAADARSEKPRSKSQPVISWSLRRRNNSLRAQCRFACQRVHAASSYALETRQTRRFAPKPAASRSTRDPTTTYVHQRLGVGLTPGEPFAAFPSLRPRASTHLLPISSFTRRHHLSTRSPAHRCRAATVSSFLTSYVAAAVLSSFPPLDATPAPTSIRHTAVAGAALLDTHTTLHVDIVRRQHAGVLVPRTMPPFRRCTSTPLLAYAVAAALVHTTTTNVENDSPDFTPVQRPIIASKPRHLALPASLYHPTICSTRCLASDAHVTNTLTSTLFILEVKRWLDIQTALDCLRHPDSTPTRVKIILQGGRLFVRYGDSLAVFTNHAALLLTSPLHPPASTDVSVWGFADPRRPVPVLTPSVSTTPTSAFPHPVDTFASSLLLSSDGVVVSYDLLGRYIVPPPPALSPLVSPTIDVPQAGHMLGSGSPLPQPRFPAYPLWTPFTLQSKAHHLAPPSSPELRQQCFEMHFKSNFVQVDSRRIDALSAPHSTHPRDPIVTFTLAWPPLSFNPQQRHQHRERRPSFPPAIPPYPLR
ncbi:hypothetical protein R3P38DRAFT_3171385 [Favolaschia claudopus]|uniref:Uncharacterized protein n=1 Tax=Favolaschia claudopus TaxID=2862362 RepID=A0AAW0DSB2_9AGAR